MAKRVFVVHCWEGNPEYAWYPWIKKELEAEGFEVEVLEMPDTDSPEREAWVPVLSEAVRDPDKDTYLIGHSIGCAAIFRYLETIQAEVGGVLLVAGFTDSLGYEEIESFFQTPFEWGKIKKNGNKFVAIHSDNDPYVRLSHADTFKEKLNAKVIVEHDKGHYSEDDGTKTFPTALTAFLELVG